MKKQILVTTSWDDGHILDLKLAKILRKYDIKATFYIAPKNREFSKNNLLSQQDILRLSKKFEIGAHTMTHVNLTKVDTKTAKKEIINSKIYLENIIKKTIHMFCYPYGAYNNQTAEVVKRSGFLGARTTKRYPNPSSALPFQIGVTTHAYTHYSDIINFPRLLSTKTIRWDAIAAYEFQQIQKSEGVFHLWGHSWEIEKYNLWEKLESLFSTIHKVRNVQFVTNSELIK